MSILCATNFSNHAKEGATVAALLAHRQRVPLLLVVSARERTRDAFAAQAMLDEEEERLSALGAEVKPLLCFGAPHKALLACIARHAPDLVVGGAPPHHPPQHVIRGTLPRVAHGTSTPMLTVRSSAPFEPWLRGERPLGVMLGVDTTCSFEAARRWLEGFARLGPVELIAARVYWAADEARRLGLARPKSILESPPALTKVLESEVSRLVGVMEGVSLRVQLVAGLGHIGTHLVQAAEEAKVDLLVVGSKQRKGLGKLVSVSHYAIRSARVAVASVPAREELGARPPARIHGAGGDWSHRKANP